MEKTINAHTDQMVDVLLARMSVREKAGQMTQITLDMLLVGEMYQVEEPHRFDEQKVKTALIDYQVGSVLNIAGKPYSRDEWLDVISHIQTTSINTSRLGIPVLYGIDAVHGTNYTTGTTLFPQEIGMAASWNPALVKAAAAITAYETRACGIPWNFSPALDVSRQPLWPRFWESFGEDTYLNAIMGQAMVEGYEGDDLSSPYQVSSCLKHYIGYGMPLNGKDRTPAWIPERFLREYYLPPFEQAVASGARTLMVSSGEINGIPTHANDYILKDILRDELGFEGLVVTDWEDIKFLHTRHRVAADHKEAVRIAIKAGIDMSMVPDDFSFTDHLIELVEEGQIPESRLDESVRRILRLKFELGLFDHPVLRDDANYDAFGSQAHRQTARQLAGESITLLKNENARLPLAADTKLLVTGCTANSMRHLNGGWSYTWQGQETDTYTKGELNVLNALRAHSGEALVSYVPGCTYDQVLDLDEVRQAAAQVDHILLCLGEETYTEFHGNMDDLNLPAAQVELARAVIATGKPVTLLMLQGRPRIISSFVDDLESVLLAYLPGNEGGNAIADVLYGAVNPSGRLPFTYPRYANALVTYDRKFSEISPIQNSRTCYDPQFEFGSGLSYTSFAYRNLWLSQPQIQATDTLEIRVEVSNTGQRAGQEIVQLYLRDEYASITPAFKRLKRFRKIHLEAGQKEVISFTLYPEDLCFVGHQLEWIMEKGSFTVMVGDQQNTFELI